MYSDILCNYRVNIIIGEHTVVSSFLTKRRAISCI